MPVARSKPGDLGFRGEGQLYSTESTELSSSSIVSSDVEEGMGAHNLVSTIRKCWRRKLELIDSVINSKGKDLVLGIAARHWRIAFRVSEVRS